MAMAMSASLGKTTSEVPGVSEEERQINQALMQSIQQENDGINQTTGELAGDPEQKVREPNQPCGLKNIGNTCYFNSILQVYYNIPGFVETILKFKDDDKQLAPLRPKSNPQDTKNQFQDEVQLVKKLEASRRLIKKLQELFGSMTKSDKKYGDPTSVLHSVVDNYGNPVDVGD